jgi:starch synthase
MQVYFIDNEEFFQRKFILTDKKGAYFQDNDERMIFFCRGVIETVKKLGWAPDIVHCHGWFTSLMPIYLKKAFRDNPLFADTRVVYSVYDEEFPEPLQKNFSAKIPIDGIEKGDVEAVAKTPTFANLMKLAIDYSDAVIKGAPKINPDVEKYLKKCGKNVLDYKTPEHYIDAYSEFYDAVLAEEPSLVD